MSDDSVEKARSEISQIIEDAVKKIHRILLSSGEGHNGAVEEAAIIRTFIDTILTRSDQPFVAAAHKQFALRVYKKYCERSTNKAEFVRPV